MKPRRVPLAWEKEIDNQVQEMFKNDIIRKSSSPWNAPILLVKKQTLFVRKLTKSTTLLTLIQKVKLLVKKFPSMKLTLVTPMVKRMNMEVLLV